MEIENKIRDNASSIVELYELIKKLEESINNERNQRLKFSKQVIDFITNKMTNTTQEERDQDRMMNDFYRKL